MDNFEKNVKYADLMTKLKTAIENDFYYESILIEYAILEDRTESLLKHAKINYYDENNNKLTLSNKLFVIDNEILMKNDEYINKHLTKDLINSIYRWKKKRNKIIHDLVNTNYENEYIKLIANEGYELIKKLNGKTTLITKYLDKELNEEAINNG